MQDSNNSCPSNSPDEVHDVIDEAPLSGPAQTKCQANGRSELSGSEQMVMQAKTHNATHFAYLNLPAELRKMVLSFYFENITLSFIPGSTRPDHEWDEFDNATSILFVSKQCYTEAQPVLFDVAKIDLSFPLKASVHPHTLATILKMFSHVRRLRLDSDTVREVPKYFDRLAQLDVLEVSGDELPFGLPRLSVDLSTCSLKTGVANHILWGLGLFCGGRRDFITGVTGKPWEAIFRHWRSREHTLKLVLTSKVTVRVRGPVGGHFTGRKYAFVGSVRLC